MPDNNFLQQIMTRLRQLQLREQPINRPIPLGGQRPMTNVDELRPWDSPVLRAAAPTLTQIPPEMMEEPGIAPDVPGGPVTPADDALIQALLRKRINQKFAAAGNQPIPQ